MTEYRNVVAPGAPAVVVAHDWFGQLPHIRALCDDIAGAGLTALAVDFYDGATTTDPAEAERLMEALDTATARDRLVTAVRDLRRDGVLAPRVFGIGFSMGGMLVLRAAMSGLFDGAIGYYATLDISDVDVPCPVQLHLAGSDDFEPEDLPLRFAEAACAAGATVETHVYPGTGHSFANPDAAAYDAGATALAWRRTLQFLGA